VRASSRFCFGCGARRPLFEIGDVVDGKHEILELLALGPAREVYRVAHRDLEQIRILKVLPAGVAVETGGRERFRREARLASRVRHPNVALVHDVGTLPDGSDFIVREYVPGEALDRALDRTGPFGARRTADIGLQVLDGLAALHAAGIVHRDVAPDNVILMPEGAPPGLKLIDLGIAKDAAAAVPAEPARAGTFFGKPRYASPEQRAAGFGSAKAIDARSDLYSVGIILAEALGADPDAPETLSEASAGALSAVIARALEKEPGGRFADASEFRTALAAARPPGPAAPRASVERDGPSRRERASITAPTAGGPRPKEAPVFRREGAGPRLAAGVCILLAAGALLLARRRLPPSNVAVERRAGPASPAPATGSASSPPVSPPIAHPEPARGRVTVFEGGPGHLPGGIIDEPDAARRLAAALRAWDYYQVAPDCLRTRAAGMRESGYVFDVVSTGCGFFPAGETLGRWRIDGRKGAVTVRNGNGTFVPPR